MFGGAFARDGVNRYVNRMQKTDSEDEAKWLKEYFF
jgi:hypothetical protein